MTWYTQIDAIIRDTFDVSLRNFGGELTLCVAIVLILLARLFVGEPRGTGGLCRLCCDALGKGCCDVLRKGNGVALVITVVGFIVAIRMQHPSGTGSDESQRAVALFTGLLVQDGLTAFLRPLLLIFGLLYTLWLARTKLLNEENASDFFVMILGAMVGMCLMVSANHMLIVFLGIEMASVPCYALAAFRKDHRQGAESSLKYAVFGAAAAGTMLYGISLLCGTLGSMELPVMGARMAEIFVNGCSFTTAFLLAISAILITAGLAFKLSAVPFQFWVPDVFEGASAEIACFLSIASKAAAIGVTLRILFGLLAVDPSLLPAFTPESIAMAMEPARKFAVVLISLLAVVTCTYGNLAAYVQTNLQRLLGYSTIAHAGYMLMPMAAIPVVLGTAAQTQVFVALGYYLVAYLFMNFVVFIVAAMVRDTRGSEEIVATRGLGRRSPGIAICFVIALFSLVGIPPLAGFAGKFLAFMAVWKSGLILVVVIGLVNSLISLFYYLRVVKAAVVDPAPVDEDETTIVPSIPAFDGGGLLCVAMTFMVVLLGLWWDRGLITLLTEAAQFALR
ncbi:MAG: NADH-quinone oxidoreductase subunit N [Planctomycetia bacterium]|nr:NADH-quinone oxidoreductase subunit N [Planctomycetia bacterium]